jgi:enolase
MPRIQSLAYRKILNSHVDFTPEFTVTFEDGTSGRGASPKGETLSVYEDQNHPVHPGSILRQMEADGCLERPFDQASFDAYLAGRVDRFGRNNAFSLSLAFFKATEATRSPWELFGRLEGPLSAPRLCLNILNGGWHAYTNPVLSDFPEFLLVAVEPDLEAALDGHREVQARIRERLRTLETTEVAGHRVHRFAAADNRAVLDCLLSVREAAGLAGRFDLMIDASASDLWDGRHYRLALTDGSAHSGESFRDYWEGLIRDYGLAYLEDPFREADGEAWRALATAQGTCRIIGDNLYASEAERIARGAAGGLTHGVVIKPNQAGSVSAVRAAAAAARRHGQLAIASHRSISTEDTFLSLLTCMEALPCIKIGPLETDYSSVVRLNEILRLTSPEAGPDR